jgi:translation initiation factor 6
MPIALSDIFGDPNVGIFSFANEKLAVLPAGVSEKKLATYEQALGVEAYGVGIADSRLVGIYAVGNSNSLLVPYITTEDELKMLESTGVNVVVVEEKRTALGNIILCNDYGAVFDPRLKPTTMEAVENALKVPVATSTIGGLPQIGSLATASNKGVLANPIIRDSERKQIAKALNVEVHSGTVNSGVPYPRSGVVVNSKGAVVGANTLGAELIAVSNAFQTD